MVASETNWRDGLIGSASFRRFVRFLFRHKGLRILGHAARRRLYVDRRVRIDDFDRDIAFYCHLNEHIGSQMYWRDSYSWNQLRVLDRLLSPEMTFVDVGANQGEFALFAAKRLTRGRVWAFEPMSEMYRRLLKNLEVNRFANISTAQLGLWSDSKTLPMFQRGRRFLDGSRHEGLATLFPTETRDSPVESIELTTLDTFVSSNGIQRVDVMKIDVEGAELEVLRGAGKTVDTHRPILIMEADRECAEAAGGNLDELLSSVEDRYRIHRITRGGRTVPTSAARLGAHQDILCLPR